MTNDPKNFDQLISEAAKQEATDQPVADPVPDLSVSLEYSQISFSLNCLESQLQQLNENHSLRLEYTGKIFWLVVVWLVSVVFCIALSGFGAWGFKLSDTVMIAFITSTTLNVIGLFVLVAKWMYPSSDKSDTAEDLRKKATELKSRA